MEISRKVLGDINHYNKYAKYLKTEQRRETWGENVDRVAGMFTKRYPHLEDIITRAFRYVHRREVVPSMRAMQFAGRAVEMAPNRLYNCSYLPIDDIRAFREIMFLLLGGSGVGYSVQRHHVDKLPPINRPTKSRRFLVQDDQIGWANAVHALVKAYFSGEIKPIFDYSDIRPKGAPLEVSGGRAPGPEPLRKALDKIEALLESLPEGTQLTPLQVHDIACHIAVAVISGGIRRAAMISLFSFDDVEMRQCKHGEWWVDSAQRGKANNSAVAVRGEISREAFDEFWADVVASKSGEPGIYWTDDRDMGTNPCVEIALNAFQFCNLTEISALGIKSDFDLFNRVWAATVIGTLQASFTDFHYLRPEWKEQTEKEALLGVSITGIASGTLDGVDLTAAAEYAKRVNEHWAGVLGINPAARVTCVKPSGNTSTTLGTSSGIHDWHSEYYIRRLQISKAEPLYTYFAINHPDLVTDYFYEPDETATIEIPVAAPKGAVTRSNSSVEVLLERILRYNQEWVRAGHRSGGNTNNVSATVNVQDHQWEFVGEFMWNHRYEYNGLSVLPYDGGSYKSLPYEEITEDEYNRRVALLDGIDLTNVVEMQDNTDHAGELACAGGSCEVL